LSAVVVVGGGPAGATAACLLAQAGRPVLLLERQATPQHKVCGEFLSGEALGYLRGLGVDPVAHGAAPITAMRLVHRGRTAESRLPFPAAGLSRRAMDELLLRRASALGAEVQRGVFVRSAAPGVVHTDTGTLPAATMFLATGKHDLRGLPRLLRREPEALIGLKLHLRLTAAEQAALQGHVEVVLFDGGYAGLQLIEDGIANLCLLVDRAHFDADGQAWPSVFAMLERKDTHLARRLTGATPLLDRPLSIFRVPYGYVHRAPEQPGVFRLGDQAAVIPSFCGDGMAIALHSARLAAATVLRGGDPASYHAAMRRDAGPPVRLAHGLYRLARSPSARALLLAATTRWPALLRTAARHTRVAPS
jgi:flavin-dependent dehydrogenase